MRCNTIILAAVTLATPAMALEVTVYEGPTECSDEEKVETGNYLSMHYTGMIDESSETGEKGKVFDSSRTRGQTFDFAIGGGQVIKGWDEGLLGLCKGAKATVVIPPEQGYGDRGAGNDIPGGATLNFDVEVVNISKDAPERPPMPNVFKEIDLDGNGSLSVSEIDAFFKNQGRDTPEDLFTSEDKNQDGVISWDEFSGPKGDGPDEL